MSRKVAAIINGFIFMTTMTMTRRLRYKTIGHVSESLKRIGARQVAMPRGTLRLYTLRGAATASAVERFGQDEPETLEWIDRWVKPGDVLWDIGANIGLYSLYAGLNPQVKVYAFEPSAPNFSLLVDHVALNGMGANVNPLCVALGNQTKIEKLHMSSYETGHACNAVGQSQTQFKQFSPVFSQAIPLFTAADFCSTFKLPPPNHIKLDVDGIEDAILAGAKNLLPGVTSIMMEVEGRNAEQVAMNIEQPLQQAGFKEVIDIAGKGSRRNRLYVNAGRTADQR